MTSTQIQHGLADALAYLNSIPPHTWVTVGVFLSSGVVASVAIWMVKYWHKLKQLEKPLDHFIGYVLGLMSSILAIADYYISSSKNFPSFFGSAAPTIFAAATAIHQFGDSKSYKQVSGFLRNIVGQKNQLKSELSEPTGTAIHDTNVASKPDIFN